jgi:hypothetical protein
MVRKLMFKHISTPPFSILDDSCADHSGRDVVHLALAVVVDPKMTPEMTKWAATKLAYFISLNRKERLVIRAAIRSLIAVLKSEPTTPQGVAVTEVLSKITELSVVDQRLFIDSGGLPPFVAMLRNSDTPLNSKELIVTTFSQIGLFFRSREAMSEAGVISALVDQPPTIELAKSTLKVFVQMSYSPDMHHRLIDAGVVQAIHRIIAQQGVTRNWKYSAAYVLGELAKRPETRAAMPLASTVDLAIALLDYRDDTKLAQITALTAMGYLAESRRFATQIIQRNGHVRVLRYLQDPWWHRIALEPAATVVANLTGYHAGRVALFDAGGQPALQALPWMNPDRRYGLFNLTIMPIVEWWVEHGILNNASRIIGKKGPFDF